MRRLIPLVALTFVSLAGCRHRAPEEIAAEAEARSACRSQPLVLLPWVTETTLVEENEYRHLVKEVSDEISFKLPDLLARPGKFERVTSGAECSSGIRVESRVVSLIHSRRRYHFKIAVRVVECGTNRLLHGFEHDEESKEIGSLAEELASRISREIEGEVTCPRAVQQEALPLPPPPPPPALPPPNP